MKKYLIRIIGALCILGVAALMLLPAWLELDGVRSRDLRDVREDVTGIVDLLSSEFVSNLDNEDFKDDLKDNDLPYTRSKIRTQFKEISELADDLLDSTVSVKELMVVCAKAPGIVQDLENVLEMDYADGIFEIAAEYALTMGNQPMAGATWADIVYAAETMQDQTEDMVDMAGDLGLICYGLVGLLGLILVLGVVSAVTHVCNKLRWLKYIFLVLLVALVAGSIVALPVANELIAEAMTATPALEDMTLKLQAAPILAVALMFIPIVLDIIFERKTKTKKAEV